MENEKDAKVFSSPLPHHNINRRYVSSRIILNWSSLFQLFFITTLFGVPPNNFNEMSFYLTKYIENNNILNNNQISWIENKGVSHRLHFNL